MPLSKPGNGPSRLISIRREGRTYDRDVEDDEVEEMDDSVAGHVIDVAQVDRDAVDGRNRLIKK